MGSNPGRLLGSLNIYSAPFWLWHASCSSKKLGETPGCGHSRASFWPLDTTGSAYIPCINFDSKSPEKTMEHQDWFMNIFGISFSASVFAVQNHDFIKYT